jgi:hypothetical protein
VKTKHLQYRAPHKGGWYCYVETFLNTLKSDDCFRCGDNQTARVDSASNLVNFVATV